MLCYSNLSVVDVTDGTYEKLKLARSMRQNTTIKRLLTNVNVRLGTLEDRGHSTGSQIVLGENMLDRVDSAWPQQGGPAGARKQIGSSGDARHPDYQTRR